MCFVLCALHYVPCTMCLAQCECTLLHTTTMTRPQRLVSKHRNNNWIVLALFESDLIQRRDHFQQSNAKTNLDGVCTLIYFTQVENTSPYDCSARLHTSPELKHRIATYCALVPSTRPCPAVPPPLISIKTRPTASLQLKMASLHLLQHQMISAACQL